MAPLLGRKPFPLAKPLAEPPGPGEEVYIIEHTKEAFRNKEEYETRLQRYDERIWTCKSTGSLQLTHKEAWEEEQEVTELLQEEYPPWFEKPVLEMVHHNTVSLDKLVEMAWLEILTKYAVGEECDFLVGKDQSLRVKVMKVHPLESPETEAGEKKLEGACDSPSSDKENSSHENQRKEPPPREEESRRESLSDRARRSPRKSTTAMKEEKKKWVMPKFLPHKYDVKLINEDKVISSVPADSLYRTERPPTKEIVRYFIRHYALRVGNGESAPWVVEDELVKKFSLPSKFSSFLLDPHKFLAENPSTKRKSVTSPEGKSSKKVKTGDTPGEDSGNGKGEKRRKKKDSLSVPLSPTIWGHMQKIKMNGSPLKVKNSGSPKKEGKGSAPSTPKSAKKLGDKKEGKKSGKSGDKKLNVLKASQKDDKTGGKTPKMKQMTLLHLAKGTPAGSPKKRARSGSLGTPKLGKPLPPMALHLLRYYKENKDKEDKKNPLSSLISKAAKALSTEDRDRLPEELRELVKKRWELLEQKRRWAAMSDAEKEVEMKKRRAELKEKLREKAKERREKELLIRREQSRRYEDQEIEGGKTLPTFKLVDMPEGIPNTLFGSVAMVVEFLHCYAGLLMPNDQYPITASSLMEALAGDRCGFLYLNRVLVVLLQTLLQDELAEGYGELDMSLWEIPLTMHSASELARLCLRPCDAHEESGQGSEKSGGVGDFDDVVSSEFLEKLETVEVFELSPEEKVELLVALCHRILMTYSVEDHVESMQQRSAELWKERLAVLKEANDRKKAEKKMRKEMESKSEKKKDGGAKKDIKKEVKVEPEPEDMISSVKSRRLMTQQAKKEKEELDRQNKERMEKEAEEERMRRQRAAAERAFQDGITKARLVMRRTPLGTDRNHNRYWLFSDVVPGLYIEKGWVHESIDYNFTPLPEEEKTAEAEPEEEEEEEEEEENEASASADSQGVEKDDGSVDGAVSEGAQQGAAPDICIETTVPKQGQNLWFVVDSPAELEELVESLHPQGVRESELKANIQSRYQDILHSIHLTRKAKTSLRACDGYTELLKYLRSDIQEVSSRLQKGGLGYLDDNMDIEDKLNDMESLKDFGECIITLQACVIKKFLQGFMAPKQKKKKKQGGEEGSKTEEVDEEKRLAVEARVATAVEKWKTAIREAQTFSRMHVLLGMLDACIKWDMSAENARCKVCRKKGDDEKLILCDECNKAFHLLCLRPALYRIPAGEWLCPACQPTVARRGSRSRNYNEDEDEEESEEESEDEGSEEDEEDEEENDYKAMGHSLRPRKKTKQSSSRPKSGKSKAKRQASSSSQSSKQRAGPNSLADIDELVRQSSQTGMRRQVMELERCEEILKKLMKFRYSWPFREPVSPKEAEDYLDIISEPMDFQTMLSKFSQGSYRHAQDFLEDMKLVFSNSEVYNQQGSTVLSCTVKTEQMFVELFQKLLPGLSYLRRHSRKRISRAPPSSEEEEEEEENDDEQEEEEPPKKMQNRKSNRSRNSRCQKDEVSESEDEDENDCDEDEEEDDEESDKRRSKRTTVTSGKKNYREQDSDGERDTRRIRKRGSRANAGGASSDEESGKRRSERTTVTSGKKNYREQDSDGERDTRGTRKRGSRANAGGASSDEERSNQQRHSKRQKRS
ncbi:tyrosine-protein kinase BAZ1B [Nothobranchius furzeri]|uniref:Tyrosine-protein kinase BAZ1B n=2 Tax=Nothobranchius furzeri TaxID=105023 RepID=A0A8C6LDE1_NOTFU|nr:tyrosine-protein kinase BAZ1B isoform X2 [Nothobranchius furzeri]KAF7219127.1 transcript variant X1 [Nothobranchius furzeri]